MTVIWEDDDREEFVKDIDESIEGERIQLVEMKELKMERDHRFKRGQRTTVKKPSTAKYSDIVKRHIQDKIKEDREKNLENFGQGVVGRTR